MDLYDEARTLVYSGPLARRQRTELDWHGWHDLHVALLDNHRKFHARHAMH
jgi:RHO1 GDP-GTP exchange protein 1/2